MNFKDLATTRYTTKKYDASQSVSEEQINELKEILRMCPSSINSQPWKFSFVSDKTVKDQLAGASFFNDVKVNGASHVVVFNVMDNREVFEQHVKNNLPPRAYDYYQNFLAKLPEEELKIWMKHQVYLALGFFLSACATMGIDSTPMEGIEADKYTDILGLVGYKTVFAVTIGYRDPEDQNQPSITPKLRRSLEDVIDTY